MNDPIADFLTRIRNAGLAKKRFVDIPASRMKSNIAKILHKEGYVEHVMEKEISKKYPQGLIRIYLKYNKQKKHVIHGLKRMSSPSRSRYLRRKKIPAIFGGMGHAILSTSRGVITGVEARKLGIGGKLLCNIW